mgnify:CR=1 FL=1
MNQLRKQENSPSFMSKNVFSKCNTNIVPFIMMKDNSLYLINTYQNAPHYAFIFFKLTFLESPKTTPNDLSSL